MAPTELTPEYVNNVIDAQPLHLAVAWDRHNQQGGLGKGFASFKSANALLTWYNAWSPKCCYEILRECAPIAVAFDIDFDNTKKLHTDVLQREGLPEDADAFLATIMEHIGRAFPKLTDVAPLVSASHKPGEKLSFHLKYASVYLRDLRDRDAFREAVATELGTLVPLVDKSVYYRNKQMRLLFSHKLGDSSRPLLPAGFAADSAADMAMVHLHMWTNVPKDAKPFFDEPPELSHRMAHIHHRVSLGSKRKDPDTANTPQQGNDRWKMTPDAFFAKFGVSFTDYHQYVHAELLGGTREGNRVLGGNGTPVLPPGDLVGDQLYWKRERPFVCPRGQTHDNNNFLTKIGNGAVFMACLSERCRHEGRMDWRVVGLLNMSQDNGEQPAASELRPWPLPRHFWFYELVLRRALGPDVRCIGAVPVTCKENGSNYDAVFHKFCVAYTGGHGHTVHAEVGISLDAADLWVREGGPGPPFKRVRMPRAYIDNVTEMSRLDWWWHQTWGDKFQELDARPADPEWAEPPHAWHVGRLGLCFPWTKLRDVDGLLLFSRQARK